MWLCPLEPNAFHKLASFSPCSLWVFGPCTERKRFSLRYSSSVMAKLSRVNVFHPFYIPFPAFSGLGSSSSCSCYVYGSISALALSSQCHFGRDFNALPRVRGLELRVRSSNLASVLKGAAWSDLRSDCVEEMGRAGQNTSRERV